MMKLSDIEDFEYAPPKIDLSNFFTINEITNDDGSVSTVYNLNDGVTVNGVTDSDDFLQYAYIVKQGDNLKLISYNKYGSIDYWWLIAKINGITDVLETLEAGRSLILLPKEQMNIIFNYFVKDR